MFDHICSDITLQKIYDYICKPGSWIYVTQAITKSDFHSVRYKVISFPPPFTDRVANLEDDSQLLSNDGIIISANKTTIKSINNIPNDIKKGRIILRIDCGGSLYEMINDLDKMPRTD